MIAEGIVSSMKKREVQLLENTILLSAIYVDPMNKVLLNEEQNAKSKEALYEL